ncbi:MAG: glycosyltransferase family 4 protein [Planctomycetes bacterium]|nr:glycosyltransferase family 4 protein [Planctomycetota bacterium]
MRIGIFVEVALDDKLTGIGRHVVALVDALCQIDQKNTYLLYFCADLLGKKRVFRHAPQQSNFQLRPVHFPKSWQGDHPSLWWNHWLPRVIRRDRLDIFHGPNHILPAAAGAKQVVTIHDLAYFKMDDLYTNHLNDALRAWTTKALDRADRVIALSKNTAQDLESLGVPSAKLRLIYGGGHIVPDQQIRYDRTAEMRSTLKLPEKYILFVGTLLPRKNVPFLLRSYAQLKAQHGCKHGLVLAGQRDTSAAEIDALLHELKIVDDVVITGYVEEWHLPLLYKLADVFVLPSRYEGFTLVTIESMAYGVPVIAARTSSIEEGTGDAAWLVELDDVQGLTNAMHTLLTDDAVRQRQIEAGRKRAELFSWKRCAQETLLLYEELGSK